MNFGNKANRVAYLGRAADLSKNQIGLLRWGTARELEIVPVNKLPATNIR